MLNLFEEGLSVAGINFLASLEKMMKVENYTSLQL